VLAGTSAKRLLFEVTMGPVTGVFRTGEQARAAVAALDQSGFSRDRINLLSPGQAAGEVRSVPTSDMEQPGAVGAAFGGVLGGALGMVAGFELGIGVTALIPGVGPVVGVGIAAAALLGAGGAVGGALLGSAGDVENTQGLPADEIFFYEDALRQGRSLVIVMSADGDEAERARKVLAKSGAESLDGAREAWWLGLRDAEQEHYMALGRNFEHDQKVYRAGFEAALQRDLRGKTTVQAMDYLAERYPLIWNAEPFRRGFERGQLYWANLTEENHLVNK
jgi:hypothetical protein